MGLTGEAICLCTHTGRRQALGSRDGCTVQWVLWVGYEHCVLLVADEQLQNEDDAARGTCRRQGIQPYSRLTQLASHAAQLPCRGCSDKACACRYCTAAMPWPAACMHKHCRHASAEVYNPAAGELSFKLTCGQNDILGITGKPIAFLNTLGDLLAAQLQPCAVCVGTSAALHGGSCNPSASLKLACCTRVRSF